MDYRGLAIIGAIVGGAAFALLPACTAPDPGAITFIPRSGAANPADESGDSTSSGSVPSDGGAVTSSSGAPTEAGAPGGDPIFGTETFAFVDPGETADGQPAPHVAPMAGKACVVGGCHGDPNPAGPKWSAAGSVYADANGGAFTLATKVELRIVSPTNQVLGASFYPDAQGNFWLDTGGTANSAIVEGSKVGIRKQGGTTMMMNTPLTAATGSNCNAAGGCHGNPTMHIYVQ